MKIKDEPQLKVSTVILSIAGILIMFSGIFLLETRSPLVMSGFVRLLSGFMSGCAVTWFLVRQIGHKRINYRVGFLLSIGLLLLVKILAVLQNGQAIKVSSFLLIILGSFLGAFLVSNLVRGWWENNAPPDPKVEAEVLKLHSEFMGDLIRTPFYKRAVDILFSIISLVLSMPVWLLLIFLIWWEDPGPVLFVKNAVGKGGKNFKQFKFRSMIIDAERDTGPISGYENDERVLFFGKLIRKTALDELPQLINILLGQMSYVGPRPQRTVLVHKYLQALPEYARRHRISPGLAGLAQVADSYDITPKEKLAWDLVYIQKLGLGLDLRILLTAFVLVFILRWRKGNNAEQVARKLLGVQKPKLG